MTDELSLLKGLHPGFILDRKLKERKISKGPFAISLNEYPQTLNAITKGKRGMNTSLALKIEHALGLTEGFFMILQIFYEIKEEKLRRSANERPDFLKLRPGLFWDTDIHKIDWNRQRKAVIQRVIERGNADERAEITRFYGDAAIREFSKKIELQHA